MVAEFPEAGYLSKFGESVAGIWSGRRADLNETESENFSAYQGCRNSVARINTRSRLGSSLTFKHARCIRWEERGEERRKEGGGRREEIVRMVEEGTKGKENRRRKAKVVDAGWTRNRGVRIDRDSRRNGEGEKRADFRP